MDLTFDDDPDATKLDEEELEGIRISGITEKKQLNELEQENIEATHQWLAGRKFSTDKIFSESFIRKLHQRMYGKVWKWAGEFRTKNKNLGVDWINIRIELKILLDDAKFWVENNTYGNDEIAIRFKHRLVSIHCFHNGNGRHSRLMADIIIEKIFKNPLFTWGFANLSKEGDVRNTYLKAVKTADTGDYSLLIAFARS